MRLVLDTNIVVSALLWGGKPRLLLAAAEHGKIRLFTSAALLAELHDTLAEPKFGDKVRSFGKPLSHVITGYAKRTTEVLPIATSRISVDPDDDVVIGTALAAKATGIVSGDKHLLELKSYDGIFIGTAAYVVSLIA